MKSNTNESIIETSEWISILLSMQSATPRIGEIDTANDISKGPAPQRAVRDSRDLKIKYVMPGVGKLSNGITPPKPN